MKQGHMEIIYDGQCPFCSSWMRMVRLRDNVGEVELIDARSNDARVASLTQAGYDLDEGMIVRWDDKIYHGAEAIHLLALMAREDGPFNRAQRKIFGSLKFSRAAYPWLVRGRMLALRLLGRKPLSNSASKKIQAPRNKT